ncbi:TRAP transporter small permease [Petroclostridium sp. X23]|uniref:TRAP transporter small permease n=1 Tax=Petroclostridium sp. X23 TaxID=3045146 RepID=UPI0024AD6413|nr:TRAP transporter small permease [Petroclostridium sp. X23]WHH57080.1 TRAP transporter small permease [Petroclostridium sp. X23]
MVKKLLHSMDNINRIAVFLCIFGFTSICFLQVVFRYVFNNSLSWSEEACRYLFVFTTFLGSALCVIEKRHVTIDLVTSLLPKKYKKYHSLIMYSLIFIFSIYLIKAGWILAMKNMFQRSAALGIPIGILYYVIPISAVFMAINSIRIIISDWHEKSRKDSNVI